MPRSDDSGAWERCPSGHNRVYLTNAYALFFAENAADKFGGDPVILEVKVLDKNLIPDEDVLAQAFNMKQYEGVAETHGMSLVDASQYWAQLSPKKFKARGFSYKASLNLMGTCAHWGTIPAKCVTRVRQWKAGDFIAVSDPTITISNYMFMGDYYKSLNQKVINGDPIHEICSEIIRERKRSFGLPEDHGLPGSNHALPI